jgi:hypothetical protein
MRIARYLLEAESTLIAEGWLRATGLRIVARRRVGSARPTA